MEKDGLTLKDAERLYNSIFSDEVDELVGNTSQSRRSDIRKYISILKGRYTPSQEETSPTKDLLYLLGSKLVDEEKPRFAARALEKALHSQDQADINDGIVHDRLSMAYEATGRYDEALTSLTKARITGNETSANYHVRKGMILLQQRKTREAYEAFQEAVKEEPTELRAYDGMLSIEAANKNSSGFADVALEMKNANPNNQGAKEILDVRLAQFFGKTKDGIVVLGNFGKKD